MTSLRDLDREPVNWRLIGLALGLVIWTMAVAVAGMWAGLDTSTQIAQRELDLSLKLEKCENRTEAVQADAQRLARTTVLLMHHAEDAWRAATMADSILDLAAMRRTTVEYKTEDGS